MSASGQASNNDLIRVLTRVAEALETMNTRERDAHTELQESVQEVTSTAARVAVALEVMNTQIRDRTKSS